MMFHSILIYTGFLSYLIWVDESEERGKIGVQNKLCAYNLYQNC